ncbi:unnamed protein product [Phytomonas sp. Hart1]|nr:unnamed protein product [Phytomonas sp. Hart1]|eukprot:CCW72174.1 unnamed protein product [Phytomonas sp. isolate Hart1]
MERFYAFQVSPGKEHTLEVPPQHGYHLSIVSFPHETTNGRTTLYVSVDGKSHAIATLDFGKNIFQVPLDLVFNGVQKTVFYAKGSCAVHCIGYIRELDIDTDDELSPFGDDDEEDSETEQTASSNKKVAKGDAIKPLKKNDKERKEFHADSNPEKDIEEDDNDEDSDEELDTDDSDQDPTQAPPSSSDDAEEDDGQDYSDDKDSDLAEDEMMESSDDNDDEEYDEEISSNPPDVSSGDDIDDEDDEIEDAMPPAKPSRLENSSPRRQQQPAKGSPNANGKLSITPKQLPKQFQNKVMNKAGNKRKRG